MKSNPLTDKTQLMRRKRREEELLQRSINRRYGDVEPGAWRDDPTCQVSKYNGRTSTTRRTASHYREAYPSRYAEIERDREIIRDIERREWEISKGIRDENGNEIEPSLLEMLAWPIIFILAIIGIS